MGKVFSWDAIEKGEIPQHLNFVTVINKIKQDLEATEGVVGGILCGSILRSCNQRSDIDCVVVYHPEKRREVMRILRDINQTAADLFVPIDLIPLDLGIARTSLHHIKLSFAFHLRYAAQNGGVIKENPLPSLVLDGVSMIDDVRGYFRDKLWKLEKGLSVLPMMGVVELHRFLQKVLESPVHVARNILRWQNVRMPDDSRQTVLRNYPRYATLLERELFAKIIYVDTRYTTELLAQLQCPDKDRYAQVIEEIKDLAWDTLEFVRLNAVHLA
ncbi:MAG: hypothetical protein Q8R26_02480 [bacterium]|nr:hypothetical protein [bacterium]